MLVRPSVTNMPEVGDLVNLVLAAWRGVTKVVAASDTLDFGGRDKETKVFRKLREEIERMSPKLRLVGPDSQTRFGRSGIDLTCSLEHIRVAVEGKYKIQSDRAIPDNRKAAFFDLYKLEQYVDSGEYQKGLFLWLTDEPAYRSQATGDSKNFSTHQGRVYRPGTPLGAKRSRNAMPLPLVLKRGYVFNWEAVNFPGSWYSFVLNVDNRVA